MFENYQNCIRSHTDFEFVISGKAIYFTKYICNNRIFVIELPYMNFEFSNERRIPSKLELGCYMLDILDIEYPKDFEAIRANQDSAFLLYRTSMKQIEDDFIDYLKRDFENVYCKNIYKACLENLRPSDGDLERTLTLCKETNSLEINISDTIRTLSRDKKFEYLDEMPKNQNMDDPDFPEPIGSLVFKKISSEVPSDYSVEKPDKFDIQIFETIFRGLLELHFKRVKEKNLYVEQRDEQIKKMLSEEHDFILEFYHAKSKAVNLLTL